MGYWSRGYYYRNRREYVGNGVLGVFAEALDAGELDQACRDREEAREHDQAERQVLREGRQYAARVDSVVSMGLTAAGFWRPSRHAWRRKHMGTRIKKQAVETAMLELAELAEFRLALAVSNKNDEMHDRLVAKLAALRAELCGPDPSPALRLAVEAAAMAWADKWLVELAAASAPGNEPGS